MPILSLTFFEKNIVEWYASNKRNLPWRHTKNPYHIWLSEVILQQTRVVQGLEYYNKFVESYPTVQSLASAPADEVLRLWQGLGYYSRARNLQGTAQFIAANLNGKFPDTYADLIKLKGVGSYTAAAIASFAFGQKVPVVDGNVYRVLARVFGVDADIASSIGQKIFKQLAAEVAVDISPVYNQAIMEFGALQCSPQSPNCSICILNTNCEAFAKNMQSILPIKIKKLNIKTRYLNYVIIEWQNKYFTSKRDQKGIWGGLYEPFLIETERQNNWEEILKNENLIGLQSEICSKSEIYTHKLTHQNLQVQFLHLKLEELPLNSCFSDKNNWYLHHEILELPKPIIIAKHFEKL